MYRRSVGGEGEGGLFRSGLLTVREGFKNISSEN